MKLSELYLYGRKVLAQTEDLQTAGMLARNLLCHATQKTPQQLISDMDHYASEEVGQAFSDMVSRVADGEPIAYVLGEWDFFGLTFKVTRDVLIPRDDTCAVAELAIKRGLFLEKAPRILDLCTGSGCIPISICKSRPDVKGRATELYPETLAVAQRNAEKHGISDRIEFVRADLFNPSEAGIPCGKKYDAIISNPPYIATDVVDSLDGEVRFEPRAALDGGADGLDFYRVIIREYSEYLKNGGVILLEIGYDQGQAIKSLAADRMLDCSIFKDFGGNDRVAVIVKRK